MRAADLSAVNHRGCPQEKKECLAERVSSGKEENAIHALPWQLCAISQI